MEDLRSAQEENLLKEPLTSIQKSSLNRHNLKNEDLNKVQPQRRLTSVFDLG